MQKSECRAWMPRQVANAISQDAVDAHNTRGRKRHPKANPVTGITGDKTGMFVTEIRQSKRVNLSKR